MNSKTMFFAIAFLLFIGKAQAQYCSSDTRFTEIAFFDSTQITIGPNVQYGIALDYLGNPDTLRMDLYYPNLAIDTSPKRPFILLFHGGGFSSGDKQSGDIKDLCIHLAMRGFVCASANYRLGYDFTEYGQYKARYRAIQDGNAAMRFIVNNANAVRIDTSWLFVGGQSAGSLLAMGMVYADEDELDAVSLMYNPTSTSTELGGLYNSGNSLTNTYSIKGIFNNWGAITASEVDLEEMLPTVAFHGELDATVLIDADDSFAHYTLNGSRAVHNELIANSICSELTVDPTGDHGIYRNASSVFRAQRASCFFKSVFCDNCNNFYATDSVPSTCSTPLALEEWDSEAKIAIYPNPVDHSFTIEGLEGPLEISIFNSFGQLVFKEENSQGHVNIELSTGVYLVKIIQLNSAKVYSSKLLKN